MEIKNTIELRKILGVEGELEEFVYDSLLSTNNFRVTDMSYEELSEFLEYGVDVDFYHLVPFSNSVNDCELFITDYVKSIIDTVEYYIINERLDYDITTLMVKALTEPQDLIADIYGCIIQDFAIRIESYIICYGC